MVEASVDRDQAVAPVKTDNGLLDQANFPETTDPVTVVVATKTAHHNPVAPAPETKRKSRSKPTACRRSDLNNSHRKRNIRVQRKDRANAVFKGQRFQIRTGRAGHIDGDNR